MKRKFMVFKLYLRQRQHRRRTEEAMFLALNAEANPYAAELFRQVE